MVGLVGASLGCAQERAARVPRVGLFHVGLDHVPPSLDALREELATLGYEDGRSIRLDWRNLPDEAAARATAREFARERVDLIVAFENQTARAAKALTSGIPVVFLHVTDPVAEGLVASLSHPGGDLTGFVTYLDVTAKQVELFRELVPRLRRLLVLYDPHDPVSAPQVTEVKRAAESLGVGVVARAASSGAGVRRVFESVTRLDVDGVFVASPDLGAKFSSLLIELATAKRLPLLTHRREWVEQGALFSYAPDIAVVGRAAARYVHKILTGTRPEDLPVEQVSELKLIVNLKTATALGLAIPQPVLARAHHVFR